MDQGIQAVTEQGIHFCKQEARLGGEQVTTAVVVRLKFALMYVITPIKIRKYRNLFLFDMT